MTIKAKLIANVLLTAAIIVAISLASFISLRFLQEKLTYLTEQSTPLQMRTLEFQRELQRCITSLIKVNASKTLAEYTAFRAEAETSLATVTTIQKTLEQMRNGMPGESNDLGKIALELFTATEERLISNNAAAAANARVVQSIKQSSARIDDLDASIHDLQANYSRAFAAALENTGIVAARLRSMEELRNLVRELQLIAVTVQSAQNGSTVLIAKAKLKAVAGRIAVNEHYKSDKSIATVTSGFADKLAEYIKLQATAIAQKDNDSKYRATESGKDLAYKLNDLFQTLDQETMLARDELSLATDRQRNIFAQSSSANSILMANSELTALELMVTGETTRLFTIESIGELDKLGRGIRDLFTRMDEQVRMLETSLTKLNDKKELKILHAAVASLATIRNEIYSATGIASTLRKKLNAIEQANRSADKLREIVIRQTAKGQESVSIAQGKQETTIAAVNSMVRRSLSQIIGIGFVAIVVWIFFGFWMYRSVLLPLRVVVEAVRSQQEQGKEKASLAEAVAGGDLDREVIVGKPIALDAAEPRNDEMGMVLNAVVGMSEAQITLDRALAGMTESLRSSRDEEARRDRLKSGLYELNKILRGEHGSAAALTDETLAFLAGFLGAGVGIFYLYSERESMLRALSTYAVSRSERLNGGFSLGQGLAGQVALERKMICLDRVPPDYLPIASALGEASPLNIAILPVQHNDTLVGVMELGSFSRFSADDFEFLDQALEGIAIAFNVNRSRQLVDDLLEQTQRQAEELRNQHEELLQTNEELEERARVLAKQRKIKAADSTAETT